MALISAAVVALLTIYMSLKRLREGVGEAVGKASKWVIKDGKQKTAAAPAGQRFETFSDPFENPACLADRAALIRYLWEATLAWCADAGSPCSADQTPLEFVDTAPPALKGFELSARAMARRFTFSEFSREPVADATLPELQQFWCDLQRGAHQFSDAR